MEYFHLLQMLVHWNLLRQILQKLQHKVPLHLCHHQLKLLCQMQRDFLRLLL